MASRAQIKSITSENMKMKHVEEQIDYFKNLMMQAKAQSSTLQLELEKQNKQNATLKEIIDESKNKYDNSIAKLKAQKQEIDGYKAKLCAYDK